MEVQPNNNVNVCDFRTISWQSYMDLFHKYLSPSLANPDLERPWRCAESVIGKARRRRENGSKATTLSKTSPRSFRVASSDYIDENNLYHAQFSASRPKRYFISRRPPQEEPAVESRTGTRRESCEISPPLIGPFAEASAISGASELDYLIESSGERMERYPSDRHLAAARLFRRFQMECFHD